jgi:translation initiation factor IF-2
VSILTAPTEYKNPFAPPAPAAAPADAAPVEANTPTPSPIPTPAAPPAEAPAASVTPAAEAPPGSHEPGPTAPAEAEPKAELKILPPEATKRVEHSWESDSFRSVASHPGGEQSHTADVPPAGQRPRREDRRGERPTFRPERERRDDRPAEPRPAWNEPGRAPGSEPGRTEFPSAPKAETPKKTGGLFGWVKKLFGGSSAEAPKPEADTRGEREFGREGQYHRRRRRGGRGRHFHSDQRGPRDGPPGGQSSGESRGYGGEHRNHGGRRRRRHPGGGDYRGGGRPEGGPPQGS